MTQLAGVHGHHDLGLGSVGQHEAGVLAHRFVGATLGQTQLHKLVV